jgi:hypothetical protein
MTLVNSSCMHSVYIYHELKIVVKTIFLFSKNTIPYRQAVS